MSAAAQGSQKWVSRWASLADSYSDSGSVSGQADGGTGKSQPDIYLLKVPESKSG